MFVRTVDNRIIEITEKGCLVEFFNGYTFAFKDKSLSHHEMNGHQIVGEPKDTPEELCDEFVVYRKLDNSHNFLRNYSLEDLHILKDRQEHNCKVYGAIWTNKGLIYVLELTKEGKSKLL